MAGPSTEQVLGELRGDAAARSPTTVLSGTLRQALGGAEPVGLIRYPHGGDSRLQLQRTASVFAWMPGGKFRGAGNVRTNPLLTLPLAGTATRFSIDAQGFVVAGTIAVHTAAAADTLCLDSPVACLFAKARIALGEVAVYPDSYTRDAARAAGKNETAVCVAATRASFDFLLLAERACGTRAVWTVDGSVRPAAGDTSGAAGFAGCRHCGEIFSSGAEYILLTSPLGHETRTCSSYDVETAAHTTVAHREREEKYMVLFDSSSPVDSAISFSDQHDRHRTDFFLDGILAAWTAKWKGKTVVMAHVKAHSGITVNEWADVEAKAALGAEIAIDIPEARPHASAVVKRPKTTAVFSAATIRVRTWACAAIQEAIIGWLRGSSTGTLRKGPGTVTPSLHDASRDAITLAQLAGDRLFASDLKHGQGASLRAARAEVCSCGSGPCDWWHYFVSCTAARAKREELFQQLHAAAQRAPLRLGRDILAAGRVDAPRRQPSFRGGRDGTQARRRRRGRVHSHLFRSSCARRCGGQSRSCRPRPCAARQRYRRGSRGASHGCP